MVVASAPIASYFEKMAAEVNKAYTLAAAARSRRLDPEPEVPIPLAKNMAERVVGLISVVAPQITNTKVTERISELENSYGILDWRVGLKIAEEVAQKKFCAFKTDLEALEVGIRVGFAYLTLGIVSAPLEGFIGLKIKKRKDGQEYFALRFAGPIRGAGGTAASTSVVLADYIRIKMGFSSYDPEESEISRYVSEVHDYHERVTNLQYHPSDEEIRFMVSNLPVEIDGDPTEKIEVSNYKDQPRIETNLIRGGMALVLAEGLCQKAPKLWKNISKWGQDFGLQWNWLQEFIKLKEKIHSAHSATAEKKDESQSVKPDNTFLMDLVAGRPILTHPMGVGGFRLRYGRSRTGGMYAVGVHPATLIVLEKYIAIGTQLKVERPRKGASVTVCDSIDGPIVRLTTGAVIKLKTEEEAKQHCKDVEEVLFLGDILFNYGDFSESGHTLVPVGYCPEWWLLELEKAALSSEEKLSASINLSASPAWEEAVKLSRKYNLPLHPEYTFYWKLVSGEEVLQLRRWLLEGKFKKSEQEITKIILPVVTEEHKNSKKILENIGCPHAVGNKESIILEENEVVVLTFCLNLESDLSGLPSDGRLKNGLEVVNQFSPVLIRDKAGTFIGARMGRPEKAKMRHLTGSPQVMFPVGDEGGRLRSFQAALEAGKIRSSFPNLYCLNCRSQTIYRSCENCGNPTVQKFYCRFCGDLDTAVCRHGAGLLYKPINLDIRHFFQKAKELVGEEIVPDLIKGVRGTSNREHAVEHLAKGILRAKHQIYVNKDGTTRYDCTELPLTHFKPKEIHTSINKLLELGYAKDFSGQLLVSEDQLLELKPQDIILPGFAGWEDSGPEVLKRVANFIDELLVKFYKLEPFYNIKHYEDLAGHLVIGLAPHISAGLVGRIIGFSEIQGLLAHPMFHAGLRRDCDGDEAAVMLLMDALLNFSRKYLPSTRGSTMDSPLVLTSLLNPAEVDDQVLQLDTVWKYPLELYEAALELKRPGEVKVEQLSKRLGTEQQYENFGFTHSVDNINKGVQCSAYKTLPSMEEKLFGQMVIAQKVRAVDLNDVARLVIQKHFLKDIKGNLKKFSMQQFRCVKCNEKFSRPPLSGCCSNCQGKLIFTISEGSVVKYLKHSLSLSEKFDFSPYLKQTIEILKENVDQIFGKEKEKQVGLAGFMD